jgi:hypothetical protein
MKSDQSAFSSHATSRVSRKAFVTYIMIPVQDWSTVLSWFLPHPMYRTGNSWRKEARLSVQRLKTQENSVLVNTYGETQS